MFEKNFYPTPREVIFEMLVGEKLEGLRILEPSAGKGDILDYIAENKINAKWNVEAKNKLYAIEKNYELQQIIKGKGYNLIFDDFLQYEPDYIFDYIIMNPPFDDGASHLLKAWEISNGAKIICLLNEETYTNAHTKERQLLKRIIDEYGEVKYLKNAFANAERKTNVKVIMVKIQNKENKSFFKFEGEKEEKDYIEIDKQQDLTIKDDFGNLEISYNKCKEVVQEIIKLQEKLEYYGGAFCNKGYSNGAKGMLKESIKNIPEITYNNFLEKLRKRAWDTVIDRTKVKDLVTSNVRNDFYKIQNQQGYMAFTKENIHNFFKELFLNKDNIAQNCVEEVFDLMTKYHSENRVYFEGWKTNDRWKVTKKVILPCMLSEWNEYCLSSSAGEKLNDIEKAMCFITGKSFKDIKTIEQLFAEKEKKCRETRNWFDNSFKTNTWYESEFFKFKIFKKGTMHLEFKEVFLYEQFNKIACKNKNWIGG